MHMHCVCISVCTKLIFMNVYKYTSLNTLLILLQLFQVKLMLYEQKNHNKISVCQNVVQSAGIRMHGYTGQ